MENFDRERAKEYLRRLESLSQMIYACAEEAEECVGYAPMEGCERFMKALMEDLRKNLESVREAIDYWKYQLQEE